MKQKSAQELLKECIDRGIECAMETPLENCRVPFDIGTEIQFDIWDNIRSEFYFEYESVIKRKTHEEMLMDISDFVNDMNTEVKCNTDVAPADESNRPVAIVRDWGRIEWQEGVIPNLGAELYMSPPEKREWTQLFEGSKDWRLCSPSERLEWLLSMYQSVKEDNERLEEMLASAPETPKREWISLNIFDRGRILDQWNTTDTTIDSLCAIIETKLKEKNDG